VPDRRTEGPPRVERSDRRVGTEHERDACVDHHREGVQPRPAGDAEPVGVHAARPAPGGVERRLHRGHHSQVGEHRDLPPVEHLGVLEAMPGSADQVGAERRGRDLEASDDGVHSGIPDDVEPGLHVRLGAADKMVGDGLGLEVQSAVGARVVAVGRPQACGAGPERTVDEEVAACPVRSEVAHAVEPAVGSGLAPVDDHLGKPALGDERLELSDVVVAADLRAVHLVHRRDPERRGVTEHVRLRLHPLTRRERPHRRRAHRVVRGPSKPAVAVVAVEPVETADGGHQRAARQRRMDVDPREIDDRAVRRAVELGGCRDAPVRPGRLVPAVAEDGPTVHLLRPPGDHVEQLRLRVHLGQVEPGEREPGVSDVDVPVDERGQHQCAAELDHTIHRWRRACRSHVTERRTDQHQVRVDDRAPEQGAATAQQSRCHPTLTGVRRRRAAP
jgi:hypothetical protein